MPTCPAERSVDSVQLIVEAAAGGNGLSEESHPSPARIVKTGGRLVKHARYYWLLLAESHLTRRLFGSMLRRIWALPVPTG